MFLHSAFCIISIHLHPPLTVKSILLFFLVIVSLLIQFHVSKFPIPYLCKIHVFSIRSPFELQIFLTGKIFYTFSLRNVLIKIKILNLSFAGKRIGKQYRMCLIFEIFSILRFVYLCSTNKLSLWRILRLLFYVFLYKIHGDGFFQYLWMCLSSFKNYVYSGIFKKVNMSRQSSILPFAKNVVVSHP